MLNVEFGVAPAPASLMRSGAPSSKFKIQNRPSACRRYLFFFVLKPLGGIAGRKVRMEWMVLCPG
jgi:hypothetical protein